MGSVKKVMLSNADVTLDLCSAIKDMGELRLVRKNIDGNEILYLRERTAFEAFKDFFGFNKSERSRQEKEISGLINQYLKRHSVGGKHGLPLQQTMLNIRTVIEQRHCLSGREIAKEMENYKNKATVEPLAETGFVAFPTGSAIRLLKVTPERVAADLALLRADTALRMPALHAQAHAALEYFHQIHESGREKGSLLPFPSAGATSLAASSVTMMPDVKQSETQDNADLIKLMFAQALKGKSGKVVVEPVHDSPYGCSDATLQAMLEAIDESITASGKNQRAEPKLKVAIAVADSELHGRINKIAADLFSTH